MTCKEFKEHIVDLCDTHCEEKLYADCMQHISHCPECKAYYDSFMGTVDATVPRYDIPEKPTTAHFRKPATRPLAGHRYRQIAAAVIIFAAGVVTGWNRLFSTEAEATPPLQLLERSIMSVNCTGSVDMSLLVRTGANDNFSQFDTAADFIRVRLKAVNYDGKHLWRIEKENGRTVVFDGDTQYMWDGNHAVYGTRNTNFAEGFYALLHPKSLLEEEKAAIEDGKDIKVLKTENDTTTMVTLTTKAYDMDITEAGKVASVPCTYITENTFDKESGLLRGIKRWKEVDGKRTLVMQSEYIRYNIYLSTAEITAHPDAQSMEWTTVEPEHTASRKHIKQLRKETATQAGERIMSAILNDNFNMAEEALHEYRSDFKTLVESMKGCKASEFSKPQKMKGYAGVVVTFRLTKADGSSTIQHLSLRNDNELKVWVLDGGL